MDALIQDLRFAVRFLFRNKRTTGTAILCLALGICVTTAVFSAVNSWVFRPLPWHEPDELVDITSSQPRNGRVDLPTSGPDFLDWRRESSVFAELGAFRRSNLNLSADDEPQRILGASVSAGLFPILGEQPILGRGFGPDEDLEGSGDVVLIGHALWERHFAADPEVVGRSVRIDGRSHTVIGVMRPRFAFPEWAEAWTPLGLATDGRGRDQRSLEVLGRMQPGVSIDQAQAELSAIASTLEQRYPGTNAGWSVRVRSFREELVPSGIERGLVLQLGASLLVLLIACANAANLLLAQSQARGRELAVRAALGATRARLVRQLLTESILIALFAGVLGAALTPILNDAMVNQAPMEPPYWVFMGVDSQVLIFTVVVSLLTGIAFGLAPAVRASRTDLVGALKEGGRSATRGIEHHRLARGLVVFELALSVVLLIGATLMIQSYLALQKVDLGYEGANVLTWRVTLPGSAYATPEQRARFARDLVQRLEAQPEIEAAGAVNVLPIGNSTNLALPFEIEGQPVEYAERPVTTVQTVSEGFMPALGMRAREGRGIERDDVENARDVAVVSEAFAARFWPETSALGRRLRVGPDGAWLRVVGVTSDVRHPFDIAGDESPPEWQVWTPLARDVPETLSFALLVRGDPAAAAPLVRNELRSLDADLPAFSLLTMDEVLYRVIWVSRLFGLMFAGLAVFAVVLASIGLYGVISYSVAERTHEVGVRLALGARPRDVLGMIVRQGLRVTLTGAAIGVLFAFLMMRALASMLWGIEPYDLATFAGMTALLIGIALLATLVPALRATRVDPMVALRST